MKTLGLLFAFFAFASVAALSQEWPVKPVRVMVPSAPGGGADTYARTMASALGDVLRQPFLVENRRGGNGNIGADFAAKSTPDIAARLDKMALVPQFGTPEEFAARLKSERERWAGIIKRLNIKLDD